MDKQSSFVYQTSDGVEIYARKWVGDQGQMPRAIVQLSHGMAEHIQRYDSFAKELLSQNLFVYGNDHRGHGMTSRLNNSTGYFADENGFEKVVHDMYLLTSIIKKDYPAIPIFLFGHSMGSLLSIRYIQLYGDKLSGVILSGAGGDPGMLGKMGRLLAAREIKKKGRQTPSQLLNKLTFGSYNNAFKPNRTEFDWLTRDEKEVDKYIKDPLCGGVFTSGFFYDLLEGIETIHKSQNMKKIPVTLPVFFISGSQDPVGNNTKGVLKTYQIFKKAGIKNVSYQFYEDCRHELLNETNKEAVQEDILIWLNSQLS